MSDTNEANDPVDTPVEAPLNPGPPARPNDVNSASVPETTPDDVTYHIERTIDHLVKGRTTPDQRRLLGKAVEQWVKGELGKGRGASSGG